MNSWQPIAVIAALALAGAKTGASAVSIESVGVGSFANTVLRAGTVALTANVYDLATATLGATRLTLGNVRVASTAGFDVTNTVVTDAAFQDKLDVLATSANGKLTIANPASLAAGTTGAVTLTAADRRGAGNAPALGASVAANTAACAALRLLDNQQFGDVAGKRTPRAPKLNGFVVGKYTKPLADDMRLVIGGDVTYEGSKYAQVHNLIETGSRAYLGARIGVENDRWNVTLWGKNLTDDDTPLDILRYVDSRGTTAATALTTRAFAITLPRPRQVGISANYKF